MKPKLEDLVAHLIATIITVGFFTTVLVSLLGYVDLKDATTASFMGSIVGFIAGSLNTVLTRYFKAAQPHGSQGSTTGTSGQQGPKPPAN